MTDHRFPLCRGLELAAVLPRGAAGVTPGAQFMTDAILNVFTIADLAPGL